jgi:hypothetical protein
MFVDKPCIEERALPLDIGLLGKVVDKERRPLVASFLGFVPKHAVADRNGILMRMLDRKPIRDISVKSGAGTNL